MFVIIHLYLCGYLSSLLFLIFLSVVIHSIDRIHCSSSLLLKLLLLMLFSLQLL